MHEIFEIKLPIEQKIKEEVILKFSNKQGGAYNIFSYYWQCYVWAATIGFIRDERRTLASPTERIFSLNTMRSNNGDQDAQALVCMCIARYGSLDILKNPEEAVQLISEYANGGFYHIKSLIDNGENSFNDFEKVKQEIFSRELVEENDYHLQQKNKGCAENVQDKVDEDVRPDVTEPDEAVTAAEPHFQRVRSRWTTKESDELKSFYKNGMTTEQLSSFLGRSESNIIEQLKKLKLM